VGVAAAALAVGCGSSKASGSAGSATTTASTGGKTLRVGYSAWPGWFPLAVADQKGFFKDAGLDVDLTYFADYTSSLDALAAGSLDVNAQTLNDTIFAVAAGADQRIVAVNDNSTGNDAVICDSSITSVKDLKGKSVAAEAGVVDHFLLLQGLAKEGMTEADIDFHGVKTDAAAAAFAGGQFDCVAVFAPFTVQAL
jgi:NitT/TauT family transport system substrate-binding protein